jgi:hypothetical protein
MMPAELLAIIRGWATDEQIASLTIFGQPMHELSKEDLLRVVWCAMQEKKRLQKDHLSDMRFMASLSTGLNSEN